MRQESRKCARSAATPGGWGLGRVAGGLGSFTPALGAPALPAHPKTSRARTGGAFILGDMFRFADRLALAVAGALSAAITLSAALASGQPGEHRQHGQPGGARG